MNIRQFAPIITLPKDGAEKKAAPSTKQQQTDARQDASLGSLTSRFLSIIHGAPDGIVDLNVAATELRIQKRRLYDITNVLEGAL